MREGLGGGWARGLAESQATGSPQEEVAHRVSDLPLLLSECLPHMPSHGGSLLLTSTRALCTEGHLL